LQARPSHHNQTFLDTVTTNNSTLVVGCSIHNKLWLGCK
jgi:hypothetical protein